MSHKYLIEVDVFREQTLDTGEWVWTALPRDVPGSAAGRTLAELKEELQQILPFMVGDGGDQVVISYHFQLPGGIQPAEIEELGKLEVAARAIEATYISHRDTIAKKLQDAGLTTDDTGELLGLTCSPINRITV